MVDPRGLEVLLLGGGRSLVLPTRSRRSRRRRRASRRRSGSATFHLRRRRTLVGHGVGVVQGLVEHVVNLKTAQMKLSKDLRLVKNGSSYGHHQVISTIH